MAIQNPTVNTINKQPVSVCFHHAVGLRTAHSTHSWGCYGQPLQGELAIMQALTSPRSAKGASSRSHPPRLSVLIIRSDTGGPISPIVGESCVFQSENRRDKQQQAVKSHLLATGSETFSPFCCNGRNTFLCNFSLYPALSFSSAMQLNYKAKIKHGKWEAVKGHGSGNAVISHKRLAFS